MFREAHPCHGFKQLHVADAVKCFCIVYEDDEGQLVHFQSFSIRHCRMQSMSVVLLFFRKPACSSGSSSSILFCNRFRIIVSRILLA